MTDLSMIPKVADDEHSPLPAEQLPWLADQLEQWPNRVHPDFTCSIGWLLRQAACEIRHLTPTPQDPQS